MKEKIGFIGLGAMGGPMARNLVKKGYPLTVCDLVKERVARLVKEGAKEAASARQAATDADVVITMLPSSPNVREAVLGSGGIGDAMRKGAIYIDMSTIDPITTREIAQALEKKGVSMLDAPVARGTTAAAAGTLSIYVGGAEAVYEKCRDILGAMGTDVLYAGPSGAGETVKIINNLMVGTTMCALAEAMVLGVKAGAKADVLYKALSTGSADSFVLRNHVKNAVLKGKFEKEVFPVDYMLKDLNLALVTGAKYNVPLYFASVASQALEQARAAGYHELYHPVVIRPLEDLTGVTVRAELTE
ncbi:MAG: NAD(P)-dependent oxidoreductase [Chloroflexota bacterium]